MGLPRRGSMFIDRAAKPLRLRSEERNDPGVVNLQLDSAPERSWYTRFAQPYKYRTPNGVEAELSSEALLF